MSIALRLRSLKLKVTLIVTAAAVALLLLNSAIETARAKAGLTRILGEQQLTLVARVAEDIDARLDSTHQALIAVANSMPPLRGNDAAPLQQDLQGRVVLQSLFDDLFVVTPQGLIVADLPSAGARGQSVADRDYFRQILKDRKPHISQPVMSRYVKQPILILTAPILDRKGDLSGILAGSLNLLKPNFLGKVATASVGKTGQLELIGRDRMIIVSRDQTRMLTQGPAPGVSGYFDHAMAGREEWEESLDSRGQSTLFSYSPLKTVPWVLVAALPAEEAFAPIAAPQQRIALLTLILIAVIAPLVWFGMVYLIHPLLRLRDSEQRFGLALEGSQQAMFDWNIATGDVFLSEQWSVMLGGSAEPTQTTFVALTELTHAEDRAWLGGEFRKALKGLVPNFRVEHRVRRKDGQWIWVQSNGKVISRAPAGRALRLIGTCADVTERKRAEQELIASRAELERAARHDGLTGLPNRNLLEDRIEQALARSRRSRQMMALFYLDLDRFKSINDTLGHAAGDALLVAFAERLKGCVREADTVARLGGDEFVILLEELSRQDDALAVADKIIESMRRDFFVDGKALHATTSIGIAFTRGAAAVVDLLKQADAALYEVKGAGRNNFRIAPDEQAVEGSGGARRRGRGTAKQE